ncbi:MAG TPA: hypothetical protein PL033_09555 [Candidatus Brocadiia bacterium]|nr:hypothetical protein [Candidatus Brocadiia bacterium]
MPNEKDRRIVRDLAKKVAEIADHPDQERRRKLWFDHNALKLVKPPIFVSPEGAWAEMMPESALVCEDAGMRGWERGLRMRIFAWENFRDDEVHDADVHVGYCVRQTGWGAEPEIIRGDTPRGAYKWKGVIRDVGDLAKLKKPTATHDPDGTRRNVETAQELLGDILNVRVGGGYWWSLGIIGELAYLHGLEEVLLDMCGNPEFIHRAMSFMTDARVEWLESLEAQGVLSLNNRNDYVGSGGFGFTDELPSPGYDGRARLKDMWGFCEAQEISGVSPAMHGEFVLQYQMRILKKFGLNCYGCCEPLHGKFDMILKIPGLRRISISPWCDMRVAAEALKDDYVFSWKPNPSEVVVGEFNEDRLRDIIRNTLEIAKGCPVEMILKDTHTCQNQPERFTRWSEIAQEEAGRIAAMR